MSSYRYRNFPFSAAGTDETAWCVTGVDTQGGVGILEWCYDQFDAEKRLSIMQRFPQFRDLSAMSYKRFSGEDAT